MEVMVTMMIMSYGLLALAYMETWGFRYNQDSESRTQATLIAYDIMDRIRNSGIDLDSADADSLVATPPNDPVCNYALATAINDRDCFFSLVRDRMPTAAGRIALVSGTTPRTIQVTVAWVDRLSSSFAGNDSSLSIQECKDNERMASADPSNGLHWVPTSSKPADNICLNYLRWAMTP